MAELTAWQEEATHLALEEQAAGFGPDGHHPREREDSDLSLV
ncbi:MAG: hypothetical protein AB7N76_05920 [Planctomycetota bacterium]